MKPRTLRIIYWATTILFGALMLADGISGLARVQGGKDAMAALHYPEYALTIFGLAKILGAISILQQRFYVVKEWAYAGFTINFIGAAMSHALVGDGVGMIIAPLVVMLFMFLTYYLWKRQVMILAVG